MQRAGQARQRAEQQTPTGNAALAYQIANPSLLAMNRDALNRASEQQQAGDVTSLVANEQDKDVGRIFGFSQSNIGAAAARTSAYGGLATNAYQRYLQERQRGTFWSNLGKGLLSVGGMVANAFVPGLGTMASGALGGLFGGGGGGGGGNIPGLYTGGDTGAGNPFGQLDPSAGLGMPGVGYGNMG